VGSRADSPLFMVIMAAVFTDVLLPRAESFGNNEVHKAKMSGVFHIFGGITVVKLTSGRQTRPYLGRGGPVVIQAGWNI
jgi:hypothetical protein